MNLNSVMEFYTASICGMISLLMMALAATELEGPTKRSVYVFAVLLGIAAVYAGIAVGR